MTFIRTQQIAFLFVCLIVLAGCSSPAAEPTPTPTKTPMTAAQAETATPLPATATPEPVAEAPTEVPAVPTPRPANIAPYTGLEAENPAWLTQRPILICVNNDAVGRSAHYGLSQADLVYEYIVDGFTLTRLTALFQSRDVDRVGPVRSARFPNVWMTYMYDGALACSGGSDEVRYILKNEVGFPYLDADIDDPSQTRYFFSIGDDYRTRMQTSPDGVRQWLTDTGTQKEWDRPGFSFNTTPPANAAGDAAVINITYPGGNSVEWRYDAGLGGYARFQGGQQQFDLGNNEPIVARNVIVLAAPHELTDIVEDSLGTLGVDIQLYGFGDLRIFRNGKVYEGTWRADPETPPRLLGPGEVIIDLQPGQSWVQVVREITEAAY
ncbi:MAG: DUF3048 domain-containing protein [Caldilineaceae bacterium]|nr:DUF3048 domain-containing protein [Caldilineaceae bacterium]